MEKHDYIKSSFFKHSKIFVFFNYFTQKKQLYQVLIIVVRKHQNKSLQSIKIKFQVLLIDYICQ